MPIRPKLTVREPTEATAKGSASSPKSEAPRREYSEEERARRKDRVAKAKDALARSVGLKGEHVTTARSALKDYLRRLNEPRQPDDAAFEALLEAPFRVPEKRREKRMF